MTEYATLVVVRQVDVPVPVSGSEEVTCIQCGALCWVQPEAREVAFTMFGSDTAICTVCGDAEMRMLLP